MSRIWRVLSFALWTTLSAICIGFTLMGGYAIVSGDADGWPPFLFFGLCAAVFVAGLLNRGRKRSPEMTPAERTAFEKALERDRQICLERVEHFPLPTDLDEPLPPWIKFPGFHPYDIFWRMGPGEGYVDGEFGPFWRSLNRHQQEEYFARYDLGTEWPHRQYWYDGWVSPDD